MQPLDAGSGDGREGQPTRSCRRFSIFGRRTPPSSASPGPGNAGRNTMHMDSQAYTTTSICPWEEAKGTDQATHHWVVHERESTGETRCCEFTLPSCLFQTSVFHRSTAAPLTLLFSAEHNLTRITQSHLLATTKTRLVELHNFATMLCIVHSTLVHAPRHSLQDCRPTAPVCRRQA